MIYRVSEKCTAKPTEGKIAPQYKEKIMLYAGNVNLKLQCRTLHVRTVTAWLAGKNSRCRTNRIKSVLYSLMQVLDFTDFRSAKGGLEMSPEIKNVRDWSQMNKEATLLVLLFIIRCSGNLMSKNSRTTIRKCGRSPSCTNHKRIPIYGSISCNSSGKTFRRKSR